MTGRFFMTKTERHAEDLLGAVFPRNMAGVELMRVQDPAGGKSTLLVGSVFGAKFMGDIVAHIPVEDVAATALKVAEILQPVSDGYPVRCAVTDCDGQTWLYDVGRDLEPRRA